jgi:spermidine synthase
MRNPSLWEKWLSYLWPIQKGFASNVSKEIRLTLINGKRSVQTAHANYSFDSLQRLLEKGLHKVPNINSKKPALILGFGAGSVLHSLRNSFHYSHKTVGVELDPVMIKLAEDYFGLKEMSNISIVEADAAEFIADQRSLWGLIIVDIFIDDALPSFVSSFDFLGDLKSACGDDACILFNLGFKQDDFSSLQRQKILEYFENDTQFRTEHLTRLEGNSELIIACKRPMQPSSYP